MVCARCAEREHNLQMHVREEDTMPRTCQIATLADALSAASELEDFLRALHAEQHPDYDLVEELTRICTQQ